MTNLDWRQRAKPLAGTPEAPGSQATEKRQRVLPEAPPVADEAPFELGLTTQFRALDEMPVAEADDFPPTVLARDL